MPVKSDPAVAYVMFKMLQRERATHLRVREAYGAMLRATCSDAARPELPLCDAEGLRCCKVMLIQCCGKLLLVMRRSAAVGSPSSVC